MPGKPTVKIDRDLSVDELAQILDLPEANVVKLMFNLGMKCLSNTVDRESAQKLARTLGYVLDES